MSVGAIIKKARKSCGLTQGDLATKASMAQSIVSAIESGGRNPTIRTLKRLARALGLRLVVRIENANSLGYEWSTNVAMAQNPVGCAGTQQSALGEMPLNEPVSRDFGLGLKL
jgi:transcriptional regulator with XRE-family HTH domain